MTTEDNFEIQLISMGYRLMGSSKTTWGKPVGFTLFTYDTATLFWEDWFTGYTCGTTLLNSRHKYEAEESGNLVYFLCEKEHYTALRAGCYNPFDFTNMAEVITWSTKP